MIYALRHGKRRVIVKEEGLYVLRRVFIEIRYNAVIRCCRRPALGRLWFYSLLPDGTRSGDGAGPDDRSPASAKRPRLGMKLTNDGAVLLSLRFNKGSRIVDALRRLGSATRDQYCHPSNCLRLSFCADECQ